MRGRQIGWVGLTAGTLVAGVAIFRCLSEAERWLALQDLLLFDTLVVVGIYAWDTFRIAEASAGSAKAAQEAGVASTLGALMSEFASDVMRQDLSLLENKMSEVPGKHEQERQRQKLLAFRRDRIKLEPVHRRVSHFFEKVALLHEHGIAGELIETLWTPSDVPFDELLLIDDWLTHGQELTLEEEQQVYAWLGSRQRLTRHPRARALASFAEVLNRLTSSR